MICALAKNREEIQSRIGCLFDGLSMVTLHVALRFFSCPKNYTPSMFSTLSLTHLTPGTLLLGLATTSLLMAGSFFLPRKLSDAEDQYCQLKDQINLLSQRCLEQKEMIDNLPTELGNPLDPIEYARNRELLLITHENYLKIQKQLAIVAEEIILKGGSVNSNEINFLPENILP